MSETRSLILQGVCSIIRAQAVEGVTRDDFPLTLPFSCRVSDGAGHRLQLVDTLNVSR
jgi:hypothetical protein